MRTAADSCLSVRELANKQKETDHLRAHVEVSCQSCLLAPANSHVPKQALIRRLDAFAQLESSRIHELQKLRGDVRGIAGSGDFSALDNLDRQLAAAGGGLFPSIGRGSAQESSRGAGAAVGGKAKITPGKKKKG